MAKDIILSNHFKLSEFTRSATASAKKIDNTPSLEFVSNLQQLCIHVLEPLREYFNCPIVISSGYRSPTLNKAVGGAKTSQHMIGEAADIQIPYRVVSNGSKVQDMTLGLKWFEWIKDNYDFDQLILEHNNQGTYWIHISYKQSPSANRHQVIQDLLKR